VVDTLIIIPNQNLFRLANEKTTFTEAFSMADDVLYQGVKGVTDLMVRPGLINLDFADVRAVMDEMGKAMMGTGEAEGETARSQAAEKAIANPLLDEISLKGAGRADQHHRRLRPDAVRARRGRQPHPRRGRPRRQHHRRLDARPEMEAVMRVSVVATGIDADDRRAGAAPWRAAAAAPDASRGPLRRPLRHAPEPDPEQERIEIPAFLRRQAN
jgi:cell division protein FtsZ